MRDKMGPLAKPTPAVIRNKGAAERNRLRRVETFVAERNKTEAGVAREGSITWGEEDAQRQREEGEDSEEDMDDLMELVAQAISQTECEAAAARSEATGKVALTMEEATLTEAALTKEKELEAEVRRRASVFLQAMRDP